MNRITLPDEPPSVQECTLCDNGHDCWGCEKFEEIIQRLWELENIYLKG